MKNLTNDDYGPVVKTLHWATVLLVLIAWTLGTFGDELFEGSPKQLGLLTHIGVGLTILFVALSESHGASQIRRRRSSPLTLAGG